MAVARWCVVYLVPASQWNLSTIPNFLPQEVAISQPTGMLILHTRHLMTAALTSCLLMHICVIFFHKINYEDDKILKDLHTITHMHVPLAVLLLV